MNFINPTYRVTFSINGRNYIIDVKSVINISIHDLERGIDINKGKFQATVIYEKKNGLYGHEDLQEFDTYEDLMSFIELYRQQADWIVWYRTIIF